MFWKNELEGKRSSPYLSPYIKKLASELYVLTVECLWMEKNHTWKNQDKINSKY